MSERKLATVARIEEIKPIEGADAIEAVRVRNWWVVCKKGEVKQDELVAYFEVDSFLPVRPEFEFLRKNCYRKLEDGSEGFRLKTIKLRGQISQGLVLPLMQVVQPEGPLFGCYSYLKYEEGYDLTDELQVRKWEPSLPVQLRGEAKGNFPSHICPKTDCERIQNFKLYELNNKEYVVTVKMDGTSFTCYLNEGEFGVASRNLDLKETEGNKYWQIARKLDLETKLRALNIPGSVAIQGELCGPGIQKNPQGLTEDHLFIFGLFINGERQRWSVVEAMTFGMGLDTVPVVEYNWSFGPTFFVSDVLEMAEGGCVVGNNGPREGLVFRSHDNQTCFKAISNKYLLKEKE